MPKIEYGVIRQTCAHTHSLLRAPLLFMCRGNKGIEYNSMRINLAHSRCARDHRVYEGAAPRRRTREACEDMRETIEGEVGWAGVPYPRPLC